jgi:WD40 repeat protein
MIFSYDGDKLVSSSDDHTIRILDARDGTALSLLIRPLHYSNVPALALHGDKLAFGQRSSVHVWSAQTGQPLLSPLSGHIDVVTSLRTD